MKTIVKNNTETSKGSIYKELIEYIDSTADTQILDEKRNITDLAITLEDNNYLAYDINNSMIYLYNTEKGKVLEIERESNFIYVLEDLFNTIRDKQNGVD